MLRNIALALLSLVLALTACEVLLRVFGSGVLPRPDLYLDDPIVGKRMRPGWSGDEFQAPVTINSKGLRNPEIPYEKPAGTYRVLALGDSWTFGFRMKEPDAYPRQLERLLAASATARGDTRRIEVINAGVVGYSTDQEAAYLKSEGWKYSPDLVLVNFYPVNDTHNKLYKYQQRETLRALHPLLLELYELPSHLYLRSFLKGARRTLKQKFGSARVHAAAKLGVEDKGGRALAENDWTGDFAPGKRGWEAVRTALQDIAEGARAHNVPVLVVLLPDAQDIARYQDRYHPKIEPLVASAVAEAGLGYFDLEPTFEPWRGKEDEILFRRQRHPNAAGYGLIAKAVGEEIDKRYLAPTSRAVVEMSGIEPPTSALRTQRSPS
jgi:lysophospholipase L1-like esterase